MPKYRVLTKSFINNAIVDEGDVIDFDGKAGSSLELIEDDKPAPKGKGKGKNADAAEVFGEQQEEK